MDISSIRPNSVTGQDISGKAGLTSPGAQTGALPMDLTEGSLLEMRLKYSLDRRQEVYHAFTRVDGGNALDARQDKITDDELTGLFGEHSSTVRSLLNSRPDIKLSDLSALRGKPEILDKTLSYLKQKPDAPFASLLSRDIDGSLNVNMTELDPKLKLKKLMEEDVKHEKLSDDEMEKLFGDQGKQMRELMKNRDDVKLSDLLALRGNKENLSEVSKLLNERKDFSFNDLVNKSADGKTTTTWSVSDAPSRQIMEHRRDVKPKELTSLFGTLVKAFDGNPAEARKAYTQAGRLLMNRSDIRPEAVGKMVVGMNEQLETIRPEGPMSGMLMNAARHDMLESSVDVLIKRKDLNCEDMTKLSEATVKSFGNEKDEMSLPRVSRSFRDATEMLGKRPDINVQQVTGFMNNLDMAVAGRDRMSLDNKAAIFKTVSTTLSQRPDTSMDQMDDMLNRQAGKGNIDCGTSILLGFRSEAGQLLEGKDPSLQAQDDKNKDEKEEIKPAAGKTAEAAASGKTGETTAAGKTGETTAAGKTGEKGAEA
ncbi:MAG: hypothetical protein AB9903_03160 [Vulcanimicrobiota bacterium]